MITLQIPIYNTLNNIQSIYTVSAVRNQLILMLSSHVNINTLLCFVYIFTFDYSRYKSEQYLLTVPPP